YVKSKKILLAFLLLAAYINFAMVPFNVLRPVYVVEVLNLGVEGLSYMGIAIVVGMITGGYLMGVKGKHVNPITAIGFGLILFSMMYMLLGVPSYTNFGTNINIIYAMSITFLFGFLVPVINAPMQAAIMKTTSPEMIGRLSSIMGVISLCAVPLGGVFISLIGDSISISLLFIIMGLSGLILSTSFWFANRHEVIV
ncbi:MAG: MFS transporter, partial [Firmicutes bacterium]|nr:MFS transporter [Bacillota bacterium]